MNLYVAVVVPVSRIVKFISFTEYQVSLFQQRYDNEYNLYHDKMYVSWLQQEHSECLPNDLKISASPAVPKITIF